MEITSRGAVGPAITGDWSHMSVLMVTGIFLQLSAPFHLLQSLRSLGSSVPVVCRSVGLHTV